MKVLLATMQFGRGYSQGTERYVTMLVDGLRRRGHEAVVLAGDPERRGPRRPLGTPLEADAGVLSYPTLGWTAVRGLPAARLTELLERERPDVVHLVNPGHIGVNLLAAARAAGRPTVVTIVDYWWLCPKHTLWHPQRGICDANVPWQECVRCIGLTDRQPMARVLARLPLASTTILPALCALRAVLRGTSIAELRNWTRRQAILIAALNGAEAVIFLSEGARRRIAARLNHARLHSITVGMEDRWFDAPRKPPPEAAPRPPAELVIGYVGALAEHKGPHLLLEAVAKLGWNSTRLRIVGGGTDSSYRRRLDTLARGLTVEFVGPRPSAEIPALLRSFDLLVVPSTWPENLPQTVLEAQAIGVPVLASNVDGIAEVIADPAMLFDVNSAAALAHCLAAWATAPRATAPAKPVPRVDDMVVQTLAVYGQVAQREESHPQA